MNASTHIIWFVITVQFAKVLCQVCVETKMGYRDVPETYLYTYMEAYKKTNCLFWCTDTRVATAIGTRNVRKLIPEQTNVCCEGYIADESNNSTNSIHCKPFCSPSCINGYCKSPGVCACNPGYMPDVFVPHHCLPLCIKGCDHGTCVAPNTCQCDLGYDQIDDVCEPVCSETCHDATCVAPDTCQCHPGYKKSENNICEPYCSGYTASGECIITIICEEGWKKVIKDSVEECEPMCTESCVHGTCIAPDICECLNGYKMTDNDSCEPNCSSGCLHGSCISPETCVCDPGWYRKESSETCLAHCDFKCGNGTCVAPNVCKCFPGYELNEDKLHDEEETAMCVPLCNNCEGSCIAPGKCVCKSPQEAKFVRIDGGPCDCLDNCTNDANKCERTICSIASTTTSTESPINEIVEESTETTNVLSTTDVYTEDDSTNNDDFNELKIVKATTEIKWFNANWFYAVGCSVILTIIIILAAAIMKKKYAKLFNANISDNEVSTAVHYKQNSDALS